MKRQLDQKRSFEEVQIEIFLELQDLKYRVRQGVRQATAKVIYHLKEERGIGTLELIFITVIVLGMAVLFRNQITEIFKKVYEALQKLNQNMNTDPLSQQST